MMLLLLATCWLTGAALMVFQYHRERAYKARVMDTRLQMHNARLLDDLRRGEDIGDIVARISSPADSLRVTLIGPDGHVIYDSRSSALKSDHNSRPEVIAARTRGEGYAIERLSEGDDNAYFYSALLGDGDMVIRSAAPYTHSLTEFLAVDRAILWIMGAITLIISIVGLLATKKIAVSIRHLSLFAEKAEKGDRIYDGYSFPHDELGDIAANIVKLYVQRDRRHREAVKLEKDKARLKKQLTDNINHELKNPVASILVNLDLLEHPGISPDDRRDITARIRSSAGRLSALLKDVATISRMEDGNGIISSEPVDLTVLIHRIAADARRRTDMAIDVDIPQLTVNGDRSLLESVFSNLIDNAIMHSGASRLTITADCAGNFRIRDNGRGIPEAHLPHIFERFYRVDDGRTRAAGGTGLGLSIVRHAVAVHGGSIRAVSSGGMLFEFNIPVVKT